MSTFCKEDGEKSGMEKDCSDLKMEPHVHGFKFKSLIGKSYEVTCNAPNTLREILEEHFYFKAICKRNQKKQLVLLTQRGHIPNVAVSLDVPCCLIRDDECLNIKFIKSGEKGSAKSTIPSVMNTPENLVTFYVKTKGGVNIKRMMRNIELHKVADYVCVFASKGEKVKAALKRDGRFNGVIFRRGELSEEGSQSKIDMSSLVDRLHGRQFQILVSPLKTDSQDSSQELNQELNEEPSEQGETLKNETSKVLGSCESEKTSHESTRAQKGKEQMPMKEKKTPKEYPKVEPIPNTEQILKLLRDQYGGLLEKLKEREYLRNKADVQRFFRQEYDKSVDSFSEVTRVKKLVFLSDSVCHIRVCNYPAGTGFLLFKKFVLTNAHVVENYYDQVTKQATKPITAVFDYEEYDTGKWKVDVKHIVIYAKEYDEMGNNLDFALLELESDPNDDKIIPELLDYYSHLPKKGAICIIGHPEGKVKKMDHCFIILTEDVPKAADEHITKNPGYLFTVTKRAMDATQELSEHKVYYNTCFFHGSSGSPVFNEYCELIGVHTGGYDYEEKGKKTRSVVEFGIPMFPILVHICKLCYLYDRESLKYFQSRNNMEDVLKRAEELSDKRASLEFNSEFRE